MRNYELDKVFQSKYKGKINWDIYFKSHPDLEYEKVQLYPENVYSYIKYCNPPEWVIEKYIAYFPVLEIMGSRRLSPDFVNKYLPLEVPNNLWLYKTDDEKENIIKGLYEIDQDENGKYLYGYKAVRENYTSIHDQESYYYGDLGVFETDCDFDSYNHFSKGFGVFTKENAIHYGQDSRIYQFKIIRVKVYLKDAVFMANGKIMMF